MNGLIIRKGKFYRNGHVERPKIGDLDQIALIDIHNRALETSRIDVVFSDETVEDKRTLTAKFNCLCGNQLVETVENYDPDDSQFMGVPIGEFWDVVSECDNCGLGYTVEVKPKTDALFARPLLYFHSH